MLSELKFVGGAIASKDYVEALTHYRMADGRVSGFNGVLALSTPLDLDITAMPKAKQFAKVIERLPDLDEVTINLTKAGRLSVRSGNFRAYVECWPDDQTYPTVEPAGEMYPLPGGILPIVRRLAPFMGVDASRPWANGILFDAQSAFATNNIIVIQQWLPAVFPVTVNIPDVAIKQLLRIGREPVSIQLEERAVTFHFEGGAWLRTSLLEMDWPDVLRILDQAHAAKPVPDGFYDAVKRLDAFVADTNKIYLNGGVLATSPEEGDGALVELHDFGGIGIHNIHQLAALEGIANSIDFTMWPAPCLFFGDHTRGAIVGFNG